MQLSIPHRRHFTQLYEKQKKIISSFNDDGIPKTDEEYHAYY